MARVVKRGEFWVVNLEPGFGREIHKKRPGLIISSDNVNQNTPHVIVIPSSSIVPEVVSPDMVSIGKLVGFNKQSVLLPVLIRSIDQDRLIKKIGKISKSKIIEVEEALKIVVDLKETI